MKSWDSKFMSPETAKHLGDRRAFAYVAFKDLKPADQQQAIRAYPHKTVGLKYDFPDEHYYYPVKKDGSLASGHRVLAIPHAQIVNDDYMKSLGYEIKPGWVDKNAARAAVRFSMRSKLTKEQIAERLFKGADALFTARGKMREDSDMLADAYGDATGLVTQDMYANPLVKETRDMVYALDQQIGTVARQMEHLARELKKK